MTARLLVGDVFDRLDDLEDGSVDVTATRPCTECGEPATDISRLCPACLIARRERTGIERVRDALRRAKGDTTD